MTRGSQRENDRAKAQARQAKYASAPKVSGSNAQQAAGQVADVMREKQRIADCKKQGIDPFADKDEKPTGGAGGSDQLEEVREEKEEVKKEEFEEAPPSKNNFCCTVSGDKMIGDAISHELEYDDVIMEFVSSSVGQTNGIIAAYGLTHVELTKKAYMGRIKALLPKIKTNVKEDKVAAFQKGATTFVKYTVDKFDNIKFYETASKNAEGQLVMINKERTFRIYFLGFR